MITLRKSVVATLLVVMTCIILMTSSYAAETSSYGVDLNSNGYSSKLNIYTSPNCTWYCWGRTYEKFGTKLPNFGNGNSWYDSARNKGYSVGATAQADSIAVFSDVGKKTSGYGHVAYVEKVDGDTVYISEGNYNGTTYHEATYSASAGTRFAKTDYEQRVIGYVYLTGSKSTPQPITAEWTEYAKKYSLGSTNAVLSRTLSIKGAKISSVTKVGIQLYDSTGKTLLAQKTEKPISSGSVINMWYDVNKELNYTLKTKTSYQYRFVAIVEGNTLYSSYFSFKTK